MKVSAVEVESLERATGEMDRVEEMNRWGAEVEEIAAYAINSSVGIRGKLVFYLDVA